MIEKIKEDFYKSLAKSIADRKDFLKLRRKDILGDPTRISKIINANRNKHYPYLISNTECAYLYNLYLFDDKDSFLEKRVIFKGVDELIKEDGTNYDKMLWGHINWDKMFKDVITEISELDSSGDLGKLFEDTLIDYVPYAVIRYDELHNKYGREYIFQEERGRERQNAIQWVYLRHGSKSFQQTFLEKFSGRTLEKFDKHFDEFVLNYLEKSKPNQYSLGLQAYNLHKNISGFAAYWQSLPEVQYSDMFTEKSDLEKQLEDYLTNGRLQIQKYKKYQQDFDSFYMDITQ